jgi:hypothetical protein
MAVLVASVACCFAYWPPAKWINSRVYQLYQLDWKLGAISADKRRWSKCCSEQSSAFTLPAPAPMPNPLSMLAVGISVVMYELVVAPQLQQQLR